MYTEKVTITVPKELYEIACMIAQAMDPDRGGKDSYGPKERLDAEMNPYIPEFYVAETLCVPEFKEQVTGLLQIPEALHSIVSADYDARWPNDTKPTLDECELFCKSAVIS